MDQPSTFTDVHTGSDTPADVMENATVAVRVIEPFKIITQNPRKQLQSLKSALRASALEADDIVLNIYSNVAAFMATDRVEDTFKTIAEGLFGAFLVNRRLKRGDETESTRRPFKGYGGIRAPVRNSGPYKAQERRKIPSHVCIV